MSKARDPVEVGKILRELRGIRTGTGVAKELGISYSMLTKMEYGLKVPGDELKHRIANYYQFPMEEIFFEPE